MRNKDEKHYRGIEKLTDNPFLNLYHIDAPLRQERLPVDEVFSTAAAHALCNIPRSRKVYSRSDPLLHHLHHLCVSSAETRFSAIF